MAKILILFAHPALERSRVNRYLAEAVKELPGVTFHDLYEAYPDFHIDVPAEKELLTAHDVIVFQHPFYWYSTPALLKEWMDHVLEHGWAYGGGAALRGKVMLNATSTGGPREAYCEEGRNRYTIRQFLAPFDQTAHLCEMTYLAPFVVYGSLRIQGRQDAWPHSLAYRNLIERLRDGTLDLQAAHGAGCVNDLIGASGEEKAA